MKKVLIIGAGVIGSSIAYHLAKEGFTDVLVLDKEDFSPKGSSAKAAGGIRQQFSTPVNVKMSMLSLKEFKKFKELTNQDIEFRQNGYLWLSSTDEGCKQLEKNVKMQKELGLKEVQLITPQKAKDIVAELYIDDLKCATFCPTDAIADPYSITRGYISKAKQLGIEFLYNREVKDIIVEGGRIKKVITNNGEFKADIVVNAAGPHAKEIAKMISLDIPVLPYRRQAFMTTPFDKLSKNMPMVVDNESGLYLRKEGDSILMGKSDLSEKPSYNTTANYDFALDVVEAAIERFPILENAEIDYKKTIVGLYAITPDHHAIIDKAEDIDTFILANGFSGHGMMHAPAVGIVVSEMILDKPLSIDISPLSLKRFKNKESILLEKTMI